MEETVSFLVHIAGAVLFCVAITLLLLIGAMEEKAVRELSCHHTETAWELVNETN